MVIISRRIRFSDRIGITKPRDKIQVNKIDGPLKNQLWSAMLKYYWNQFTGREEKSFEYQFYEHIWFYFLELPIDAIPRTANHRIGKIRHLFFKYWKWYEIYNFMEFIVSIPIDTFRSHYSNERKYDHVGFKEFCNAILKEQLSVYRFVRNYISRLTSEEEIKTIEESLASTNRSPLNPVHIHLDTALKKLSDRKNPDYRNSIKESISAVESICKIITNMPDATLSPALDTLVSGGMDLHPDLKSAFKKLYGYTSDAHGIRHALMDNPNLDFEDAKFMLVSCTTFINYLIVKAQKAGTEF